MTATAASVKKAIVAEQKRDDKEERVLLKRCVRFRFLAFSGVSLAAVAESNTAKW
jgi:hypothetical protein